jgi:hypothetical protein
MFFSGSKDKLILIIDVQSSIVRGTLVLSQHGAIPRIVNTHSIAIPYKPTAGSAYLIKMALKAVEEVVRDARMYTEAHKHNEHFPNKISCVHYVLSSPWIVSQAKTLSVTFKQDTVISQAYITGMIWEERAKMTSNTADDVRIIEEKVFDVRLNGYSVASWESRHTRDLGVSFIVSIAGGRMIDKFIDECRDIVRADAIKFHSSLFLQHLGIQTVVPGSSSYGLVHAHGELTDVAVINQRSCTFFGSYPYGVHTMVREMAAKMKTTDDSAESTITMILKGDLDTSRAKKESEILDELGKKWIDNLKKLLAGDSTHALPAHIIVSSRAFDELFMRILKSAYPEAKLEMLSLDQLAPHVHFDPSVDRLRLSALYALAVHSL